MSSREEKIIRRTAKRFVEGELKKVARDLDEKRVFPRDLIDKIAEQMGIFGIMVDPEYGGAGGTLRMLCIALEEIGRGCASTATIVLYGNIATHAMYRYGGEEIRKNILTDAALGIKLPTFAINEPNWDYSLGSLSASAEEVEDGFVLRGIKSLVPSGTQADVFVVVAKLGGEPTGFVLTREDGARIAGPTDTLGLRAAHLSQLILDGVKVPKWRRLNMGLREVNYLLSLLRVGLSAIALGVGAEAYDMAREYANVRVQFGVPIGRFEAVQDMLVRMLRDVETSRRLLDDVVSRPEKELYRLSTLLRVHVSESMLEATKLGIRVHGGYGYMREMPLERFARDVRTLQMLGESVEALKRLLGEIELGYVKAK